MQLFLFIVAVVCLFLSDLDNKKLDKEYKELKQKFDNLKFEHFKLISDSVSSDKELQEYKNKYNNLVKDYVDVRAKNVKLQQKLLNKIR